MQKGVLDQVPQPVELFVIPPLLPPVFPWRYLRFHSLLDRLFHESGAVVALARQQVLCPYALNQLASLRAICNGTCRDKYSDWHTMRIHGQVQLRIVPPFVRALS